MEIRIAAGYRSVADVDHIIASITECLLRLPANHGVIIAADWRNCGIMSPETSDRAREMLKRANPRVLRSAILTLPVDATRNLQVVRIIRESSHENRRHFTLVPEMKTWLAAILTPPEFVRLGEFLPD